MATKARRIEAADGFSVNPTTFFDADDTFFCLCLLTNCAEQVKYIADYLQNGIHWNFDPRVSKCQELHSVYKKIYDIIIELKNEYEELPEIHANT
jgi:hypothetical protein